MKSANVWLIVTFVLVSATLVTVLWTKANLDSDQNVKYESVSTFEPQGINNEEEKKPVVSASSVLVFHQDDIFIDIDLSKAKIQPAFNFAIGPVLEKKLSPNKEYLYFTTGQGGGTASFMYQVATKTVYYLGNDIRGTGEWNAKGLLEVINKEEFGENIGATTSIYQSINKLAPWSMISIAADKLESEKVTSLTVDRKKWIETTVFDHITLSYPPEFDLSFPDDSRGSGALFGLKGFDSYFIIIKQNLMHCIKATNCNDLGDLSTVTAKEFYDIELKSGAYVGDVNVGNLKGVKMDNRIYDTDIIVLYGDDVFSIVYVKAGDEPLLNQKLFYDFVSTFNFHSQSGSSLE